MGKHALMQEFNIMKTTDKKIKQHKKNQLSENMLKRSIMTKKLNIKWRLSNPLKITH